MTQWIGKINLPEQLCARAEALYARQFSSMESLVVFLLEEITRQDALRLDHSEQLILEDRLKALGYL